MYSLGEFCCGPGRARRFVDTYRTVDGHALEEFQHVGVAQTNAPVGTGHAHGFAVGRPMEVDIAAKTVHLPQAVAARLATTQPEYPSQDPVTPGKARMEFGIPNLACPAPPAKHGTDGQPFADPRTHLMKPPRGAIGATGLSRAIQRRGDGNAQHQLP
ncbi:hypothetical protein ppKF707_1629 [Metapseudomonas furukawaii]|uniref:Uncharacterized protein n=1 Tax=Metapseudomonas furukawaii TaxID=1149133 RepID=A0AAD1FG37_METFU|nr:hypothetical protein ppKF707_1629 [Pseudomonas furukawaii]BAU75131.1 hypothetical protein KF707C_34430 [Pseudomonas furukawaii]